MSAPVRAAGGEMSLFVQARGMAHVCNISDEDLPFAAQQELVRHNGTVCFRQNGRRIQLARHLLGAPDNKYIKYLDRNKLNLQWQNLRIGEEQYEKKQKSPPKGMVKTKDGRFHATLYLGQYKTQQDAEKVHKVAYEVWQKKQSELNL